jgi:polysaccharide pyruvyl transferase WcaK-like protein
MKNICVIGNFSGRNSGDAAILEGLLNDVCSVNPQVHFIIPTINKRFIEKTYKRFSIKAVPLMPWNLSLKILGLPIFTSVLSADLVLVTDAILFDRRLLNPLYNYLSTMSLVIPYAKKRGIPVVLYNVSLGPVTSNLGRTCTQRIVNSSDLIIVRDEQSIDMLKRLRLSHSNLRRGADCALNAPNDIPETLWPSQEGRSSLCKEDRFVTVNVTSNLDAFVKGNGKGIRKRRFVAIMANIIDRIIEELAAKVVILLTHPSDLRLARRLQKTIPHSDQTSVVSNKTYTHNQLAGILSQASLHVGMRTHSLILATSSCTPTVAIVTYPKNMGYMKSIGQEGKTIEFGSGFTEENIWALIKKTWEERENIRKELGPAVMREKKIASASAKYLEEYLR